MQNIEMHESKAISLFFIFDSGSAFPTSRIDVIHLERGDSIKDAGHVERVGSQL